MTALLATEGDTSPCEGLIPKPSEPIGAPPSLLFSPNTAEYVTSMLLLNLMATTEVFEMVLLVNEAFQCLGVYDLDL